MLTWFYMQSAGSSMHDIVAHDLQQIPRILATIRSLMCVLRARLMLQKGIGPKIRVCKPALALITSVHARKEWDMLGQTSLGDAMGKNCLTSLAFYEALKVTCVC
jgi:hypothetical protein